LSNKIMEGKDYGSRWDNITWHQIRTYDSKKKKSLKPALSPYCTNTLVRDCLTRVRAPNTVGDNVTWPRITRIHVYFVTLQIIHWYLLRSCPGHLCLGMPGQDRNKNQCVFCNVVLGQVTLSPTGSHLLHWNRMS
jgi:hypothetical protein